MKRAEDAILEKGVDTEMMSDSTLCRLIEYLKMQGWSDTQIVNLLDYLAKK